MKRTNIEGNDVTETPLTQDASDRVELSGNEYDAMIARLDMASVGIAKLTEIIAKIKEQLAEEERMRNKKKGVVLTLEEAGGFAPMPRTNTQRPN